jgi:hypothetical protein
MATVFGGDELRAGRASDLSDVRIVDSSARRGLACSRDEELLSALDGQTVNPVPGVRPRRLRISAGITTRPARSMVVMKSGPRGSLGLSLSAAYLTVLRPNCHCLMLRSFES